jgi:hypothetical protein
MQIVGELHQKKMDQSEQQEVEVEQKTYPSTYLEVEEEQLEDRTEEVEEGQLSLHLYEIFLPIEAAYQEVEEQQKDRLEEEEHHQEVEEALH